MLSSKTLKELQLGQKKLDEFIIQKNDITDTKNKGGWEWGKVALFVEIGELANELKTFKRWKKQKEVNWKKAQEELIDCLHFYLSFANNFQIDFADYKFSTIFPTEVTNVIPYDLSPNSVKQFNQLILGLFTATEKMIIIDKKEINPEKTQKNFYHWLIVWEELGQRLGMNEEDIIKVYLAKNKINWERQKNNY